MKISILMGPWLPVPPIHGGSTGRIWTGLAEEFVRAGHEVTMVAPTDPNQPEEEVRNGVSYKRIRGAAQTGNIGIDLIKDYFYARRVRAHIPPGDITIFHDFWLAILVREVSGKVVFVGRMPRGQYRFVHNVVRYVVASQAVKERLLQNNIRLKDCTSLIPCPIENEFLPKKNDRQRRLKTFLYVGRIHPEKGIELLIEAFAKISDIYPDAELACVGPTEEKEGGGGLSYLDRLRQKAKDKNVSFHAPIYNADALREMYISSKYFVYPSLADRGETFGLAPLEAMGCGCVPIVSKLECFNGHLRDRENALVFDHESLDPVQKLFEAMAMVLKDQALSEKLQKNGEREAQNYSYQKIGKLYLDLFQKIS